MTAETHYGRIVQGGGVVASVSAPNDTLMMGELWRYYHQYLSEGPLRLEIRRTGTKWREYRP